MLLSGGKCSLWGAEVLTLGSGSAHFGERKCSLWGAEVLTLGSGSAHFGERKMVLTVENNYIIRL